MALATVAMIWGWRLVSQRLAQRAPWAKLVPGRPESQSWTPCGDELVGSFHSTSGDGATSGVSDAWILVLVACRIKLPFGPTATSTALPADRTKLVAKLRETPICVMVEGNIRTPLTRTFTSTLILYCCSLNCELSE